MRCFSKVMLTLAVIFMVISPGFAAFAQDLQVSDSEGCDRFSDLRFECGYGYGLL